MILPVLQRVHRAMRELGDLARGVGRRETLGEPLHVGHGDRRADAREEIALQRDLAALRHRVARSAQIEREDVDAVGEREVAEQRLELVDLAVRRARALGEDEHRLALREDLAGLTLARAEAALAVDRAEVREVLEERALERALLEEVVLRRERDDVLAVGAERVAREAHVEVAAVVRGDDRVAVVRDERAAADLRAHHLAVEEVLDLADELLALLLQRLGEDDVLVVAPRAALDLRSCSATPRAPAGGGSRARCRRGSRRRRPCGTPGAASGRARRTSPRARRAAR